MNSMITKKIHARTNSSIGNPVRQLALVIVQWLVFLVVAILLVPVARKVLGAMDADSRVPLVQLFLSLWITVTHLIHPAILLTRAAFSNSQPQSRRFMAPLMERARHEAAHAIVAHELGILQGVDVIRLGRGIGGSTHLVEMEETDSTAVWNHMTVCAASIAMSSTGVDGDWSAIDHDVELLAKEGERYGVSRQKIVDDAIDRASRILLDHLDDVEVLARELARAGNLTLPEVARLLEDHRGRDPLGA